MYQYALVQMLYNTDKKTYHPIFYYDKPLPGGMENNNKIIRYKSKGHHTTGFASLSEANESAKDLIKKLQSQGDIVHININEPILWDGKDMPLDTVILPFPNS